MRYHPPVLRFPSPPRLRPLFHAGVLALLVPSCAGEQWTPPPPAGVTYQYDYQGFRERNTTVIAGSTSNQGMGVGFAGVFSFQDDSELRGPDVADPFTESTPIDGLRFNSHLGTDGIPVTAPPSSAPPAAASAVPAPSSSAWSVPPPASAPVPGGYL